LDFQKLEILTAFPLRRTSMHHLAEIWPIIDFSGWRPSAFLYLFYTSLVHRRGIWLSG